MHVWCCPNSQRQPCGHCRHLGSVRPGTGCLEPMVLDLPPALVGSNPLLGVGGCPSTSGSRASPPAIVWRFTVGGLRFWQSEDKEETAISSKGTSARAKMSISATPPCVPRKSVHLLLAFLLQLANIFQVIRRQKHHARVRGVCQLPTRDYCCHYPP